MSGQPEEEYVSPPERRLCIGGGHPLRITGWRVLDPDYPTKHPTPEEPIADPARWPSLEELDPYIESLESLPFHLDVDRKGKYDPVTVKLTMIKEEGPDGKWSLGFDFGTKPPWCPITFDTSPVTTRCIRPGSHNFVQAFSFTPSSGLIIDGKRIDSVDLHYEVVFRE